MMSRLPDLRLDKLCQISSELWTFVKSISTLSARFELAVWNGDDEEITN